MDASSNEPEGEAGEQILHQYIFNMHDMTPAHAFSEERPHVTCDAYPDGVSVLLCVRVGGGAHQSTVDKAHSAVQPQCWCVSNGDVQVCLAGAAFCNSLLQCCLQWQRMRLRRFPLQCICANLS